MSETPGFTIASRIDRPSQAVLDRFRGLAAGNVADANANRGALHHSIRAMVPVRPFVGAALTVQGPPDDNLGCYAAVALAEPGDVILCTVEGFEASALVGDIFIRFAANKGIAGFVTDGLVRDVDGLAASGVPVYARGTTPNSPQKNGPVRIGLPIQIGGQRVCSGDLVVGDNDGVVVVPRDRIAAVLDGLAAVHEKESTADRIIAEGATEPLWLRATMDRLGIRHVD